MGQLINGQWRSQDQLTNLKGEFKRTASVFVGNLPQAPQSPSQYLLIASRACPWAHRVLLARNIKGLSALEVHYAPPELGEQGWRMPSSLTSTLQSSTLQGEWVHTLYTHTHPTYTGRVTLPLLWDQKAGHLLSNDSTELLWWLLESWPQLTPSPSQLSIKPISSEAERAEIQGALQWITSKVTNGPYRAIFSTHQALYEENVVAFFEALDVVEERLQRQPFFMGESLSACDLTLFPTLYRLELAYRTHLKCALKRLSDYPALTRYTQQLSAYPEFFSTLNPHEVEVHYGRSVPKQAHVTLEPALR